MKTTKPFLAVILILAFAGLLLAIGTSSSTGSSSSSGSSALLQVSSYSTVPATVYAGTQGYLEVTIVNNGQDTASSAQAVYTLEGSQQTQAIGDLASGSSTLVSIPFSIDPSSSGGIQVVSVTIDYIDESASSSIGSTSSSSFKTTSLSVPLQVSQSSPLVVNTVTVGNPSIAAGEPVSLQLSLENNGGVVNNLAITVPPNSSFALSGTSQLNVGTIPANATENLSLTLLSSTSTPIGTYTIPLQFTYYDRLNTPNVDNLSVGPVNVQDASTQYRLALQSTPVEVGSQATVQMSMTNTGTQTISAVVDVNSTSELTPIGTQDIYFDNVAPGQTQTQNLMLGVSASATPGYYALPLTLTMSTGNVDTQNVGIAITATPAVTVSINAPGTSTATLLIANTGNSGIRSVYAVVSPTGGARGAAIENFIGTLNVDDYGSVPLTGMSGTVLLNLTFKDSLNVPHEIDEDVNVGTGNATFVGGSAYGGARGNFTGGAGGRGGVLGGLLGGGARPGSSSGGLPLVPIGIGIVILIIAAFFIRRHLGEKKKKADAEKKAAQMAQMLAASSKGKESSKGSK